jgi:membrane fusion protein, copper/silver efflux system
MRILAFVALAVLPLASSCTQATDPVAPAPEQASDPALSLLDRVLGAYDTVRAQLAADSTDAIDSAGQRIALAAREAKAARAESAARLETLAAQADSLAKVNPKDIAAVRAQFGELSREVVTLLAETPALQKGRHVFECPMAVGYQKWVQPSAEIQNPYMGKSMLACGASTTW